MSAYRWEEGPCSEGAWLIVHRWPGQSQLVLAENVETGERVTRPWLPKPEPVPNAEPAFIAQVRRAKREASERRRGIQPGKKDPLAGQRNGLADGTASRLIYPGGSPCPVTPGQAFTVRGGIEITVLSCVRKLKAGEHRWECSFERRVPEKPLLLRRVPPITEWRSDDDGQVLPPMAEDIDRARLESSYTTTPRDAVPDTGDAVDPNWEDRGKEQREVARIESRKKIEVERDLQAAKSRLNRLLRGLDAPAQKVMLAEISRLCDEAERAQPEALKDAA